jgi:hypothetical protein
MTREHNSKVHRKRVKAYIPKVDETPELASAWHSLQLHWLDSIPGYREEIKQRVAVAAKQAEKRLNRTYRQMPDLNNLDNEIDPCG